MEDLDLKSPLVSVIVPTFNSQAYIAQTIGAVLAQTYANLELIVVDDGSTDGTAEMVLESFGDQVLLLRKENAGAAAARNHGLTAAHGEFIKFLDADDLINPDMIRAQTELAMQNEHCIISASWGRFYHNDTGTFRLSPEACWETMPSFDWLLSSWENGGSMTNPGLFLIPRGLIDYAGGWNTQLTKLDDTEYFTRTILQARNVVFCENAILYYRSGNGGNLSGRVDRTAIRSSFHAYERSIQLLLKKDSGLRTKLVCANMWQQFVFDTYPAYRHLTILAESRMRRIAKPTIRYQSGRIGRTITALFGWKLTRRLQLAAKKKAQQTSPPPEERAVDQ